MIRLRPRGLRLAVSPTRRGSRSRAPRPAGASFALKRLPSQTHQGYAFARNGLQAHRERRLARLDQVLRQGAGTAALTAQPGLRVVQVEERLLPPHELV